MAHTASGSSTPPRRKLEIALGVVVLLIGAALVVVTAIALNHPHGRRAANATGVASNSDTSAAATKPGTKPGTTKPSATSSVTGKSAPPSTPSSAAAPPTSAGKLPLVVLNNTSSTTAATAGQRFQAGGWTVSDTSTFQGSILSTAVYYDPNVAGAEAAANALQQQFPAIKRVKAKFDGLPSGPLIVVLTSDYS